MSEMMLTQPVAKCANRVRQPGHAVQDVSVEEPISLPCTTGVSG